MLSSSQKTDISERWPKMCGQYTRQHFNKDVQKLRDLIQKCEELEVNNRNFYNSVHYENPVNSSRYYK